LTGQWPAARCELTRRWIELSGSNRLLTIVEQAAIEARGIAATVDGDGIGLCCLCREARRQQSRDIGAFV
jgi:hypothetical protein